MLQMSSEPATSAGAVAFNSGMDLVASGSLAGADAVFTHGIVTLDAANTPVPPKLLLARSSNRLQLKSYADAYADAARVVKDIDAAWAGKALDDAAALDLSEALLRVIISTVTLGRVGEAGAALQRLDKLTAPSVRAETRQLAAQWLAKATAAAAAAADPAPADALAPEGKQAPGPAPVPAVAAPGRASSTTATGGQATGVRESFFEQGDVVTVTYYAKGVDDSRVSCCLSSFVDGAEGSVVDGVILTTSIRMPDESVYTRRLALFGPVQSSSGAPTADAASSSSSTSTSSPVKCNVTKFKVEVPLRKLPLAAGLAVPTWGKLEYDPAAAAVKALPKAGQAAAGVPVAAAAASGVAAAAGSSAAASGAEGAAPSGPPAYPSSKAPGRDWSAVEASLEEAGEGEDDTNGMHGFLQKIFANADPDTRRAMMKSYQTSKGTVLSTNWAEVSKTDYSKDIRPPEGQEFRK